MSATTGRVPASFDRDTFVIDRTQEFFQEDELSKQIGHARPFWAGALLKELIDNGLDAAESVRSPEIKVRVGAGEFVVEDNGDGIAPEVVESSLDYTTRTTDKAVYVSPTRGRQGNALKTLWAAPYVVRGLVEAELDASVESRGVLHAINVTNSPLAGRPEIGHRKFSSGVKTGTRFGLVWPNARKAMLRRPDGYCVIEDDGTDMRDAYLSEGMTGADRLVRAFSLFNPHASFSLEFDGQDPPGWYPAREPKYEKWLPKDPSPPHWYSLEQFESLLGALLRADLRAGRDPRSVREVVSSFRGLSSSAKRAAVCGGVGIPREATIADLFPSGQPDRRKIRALLTSMNGAARPVAPKDLGAIGERLFAGGLRSLFGADDVRYRRAVGGVDADGAGAPFVLEVAFGVGADYGAGRTAVTGVNWSPSLRIPFEGLADALQRCRVDDDDPAVLAVHLAYPTATATDRGKSRFDLPSGIRNKLFDLVDAVTKEWQKEKATSAKIGRQLSKAALDEQRKGKKTKRKRIIDAAYEVMAEAYAKASGGLGIAAARQVMYAARALIIERYGIECVWKDSKLFTQRILPKYLADYPDRVSDWDVVFDDRGHFQEPHTSHRIGIGTVSVREYIEGWAQPDRKGKMASFALDHAYPTRGPQNRFRNVLFVEKQGFDHLLHRARIQERFDVALMSTKGMTVVACRQLIDRLSAEGVRILVLHDFDKAGLGIFHTMRTSNHRYKFKAKPQVIDLGLRLADVERLGLASETVEYTKTRKDPRDRLALWGATTAEQDYLVRRRRSETVWEGERVELNSMTSDQFVRFVEEKFAEHGVVKVTPDSATLTAAFQRAARIASVESAVNEAIKAANTATAAAPTDLAERVEACMRGNPLLPWDEAVYRVAQGGPRM